jgi:hypothetical protein
MSKHFEQGGLSFDYPATWRLEREENDDGWTVLLQAPGTAFMTITCDNRMPLLEQVIEETLETLRSDYPALEAEARIDGLAGQMAVGHEIHFFSLDLTNTCRTRCFYTDEGTVLVLCQAEDAEWEECEPQFRAVCASLRADTDATP